MTMHPCRRKLPGAGLAIAMAWMAAATVPPANAGTAVAPSATRDLRIVEESTPPAQSAVGFPGLLDAGGDIVVEVMAGGEPVNGSRVGVGMRNMQFRVSSRIPGTVVLYDEKIDGTLYGLFPNRYSNDCDSPRVVSPGKPLTIPAQTCFEVVVEPPLGAHRLILLLLPQRAAAALAERPFFAATRDLRPVPEPRAHLDQVQGTLARYCLEQAASDARCYLHIQPYEVVSD